MKHKINSQLKKVKYTVFVIVYFSILVGGVKYLNDRRPENTYVSGERIVADKNYADRKSAHLVGLQEIDGKKYYFDEQGMLKTGWINISEKERYYADDNGEIVTGEQVISDVKYEFDEEGKLVYEDLQGVKMVALTFDDGPSVYTDRILDVLEKYNAKATFFLVGERVADYSSQLKREFDLGCQIGSHTYNHKYLTSLSFEQLKSEIEQTDNVVEQVTGYATSCIRPPGGFYDERVFSIIDCPVAMWSVDTLDWKNQNADSVTKIATTDIEDGDIILMHDLYETTAEAVERIVPELINQGFKLVTFSELIDANGGVFSGTVYYSAEYKITDSKK